jgi:serine/threonine protein kinase
MKAFPHPLILKIIDDFVDSAGHLCIVKDRYFEGNFSEYFLKRKGNPFSEPEILHFLANIFLVIFHLNSRDILHRNLNPEGFLVKREANGKT